MAYQREALALYKLRQALSTLLSDMPPSFHQSYHMFLLIADSEAHVHYLYNMSPTQTYQLLSFMGD